LVRTTIVLCAVIIYRLTNTMDTTNTCTPTKDEIDDVLSIITPEMKKTLFPVHDDDSGIGMEFKKVTLFSKLFESLLNV
jgi:hypothetical protein